MDGSAGDGGITVSAYSSKDRKSSDLLSQVISLEKKSFPKHESMAAVLEKELGKRNTTLYIAMEVQLSLKEEVKTKGGEGEGRRVAVVGYCLLQGNYISKLLVVESKRRCGVGSLLIDESVSKCRENRQVSCCLHVGSDREGAIRLYEKKGFTVGKRIKDYYIEGRDAFHMELKI